MGAREHLQVLAAVLGALLDVLAEAEAEAHEGEDRTGAGQITGSAGTAG